MATITPPAGAPEAEPVTIELDADRLSLTLDDGTELALSHAELQQAIDGEQAPGEVAA